LRRLLTPSCVALYTPMMALAGTRQCTHNSLQLRELADAELLRWVPVARRPAS
jgi:hypothetical protein